MWESIAKYMKKFRFKNTVHPKIKGTFVFNDASIHVVTFLKMQQSWFSSYLFLLFLSQVLFHLIGKKVFLKLNESVLKIFLLLCDLL